MIKFIKNLIARRKCICPSTCDCNIPDFGEVRYVSMFCPIHNNYPVVSVSCLVNIPVHKNGGTKRTDVNNNLAWAKNLPWLIFIVLLHGGAICLMALMYQNPTHWLVTLWLRICLILGAIKAIDLGVKRVKELIETKESGEPYLDI